MKKIVKEKEIKSGEFTGKTVHRFLEQGYSYSNVTRGCKDFRDF
jgi:hypothetical protein